MMRWISGLFRDTASAADVFAASLPSTQVDIKGLGKPVEIRQLSVDDGVRFSEFQASHKDAPDNLLLMAELVVLGCPAFERYDAETVRGRVQSTVLVELANAVLEFSGMTEDQAKTIEKKSESSPGSDSS